MENKRTEAVEHLKIAVSHEDALAYDEPPQWMFPARQALGGAYLTVGTPPALASAVSAFCGARGSDIRRTGARYTACSRRSRGWATRGPAKRPVRFAKAWPNPDYQLDGSMACVVGGPQSGGDRGGRPARESSNSDEVRTAPAGAAEPDPCPLGTIARVGLRSTSARVPAAAEPGVGFALTAEQRAIEETAREFARREIDPIVDEIDEAQRFPHEVMKKAGELGFLGVIFPEEWGGAGLGYVEYGSSSPSCRRRSLGRHQRRGAQLAVQQPHLQVRQRRAAASAGCVPLASGRRSAPGA